MLKSLAGCGKAFFYARILVNLNMTEAERIARIAEFWLKVRPLKDKSSRFYTSEDTNNAHALANEFNTYVGRHALKVCSCAIPHNLRVTGTLLVKAGYLQHWNDREFKQITYKI